MLVNDEIRAACKHYLMWTEWAGELGQPVRTEGYYIFISPAEHKKNVRQICKRRAECHKAVNEV